MTPPRKGGKPGVRAAIENAEAVAPGKWPGTAVPGFDMRSGDGLYRETQAKEGKGATEFFVTGYFEVRARTRDGDGNRHGILLAWTDADGVEKELIVPRAWLLGDARELRSRLADMGLPLAPHAAAAAALVEFLSRQKPTRKIRTVTKPGWYHANPGAAFVLPRQSIGHVPGEEVRLDMEPPPAIFRSRGVQAKWRDGIAAMARGNRLVMFVIAAAMASPLLEPLGEPSGGFNLQGRSRSGKTTLLWLAASVWGPPAGHNAFIRSWDSSTAHFEAALNETNGTLAALDEAGTADPHRVGNALYMLGGGAGRGRATANGRTRDGATWSLIALSTAELSFPDLFAASGQQITAGQASRLVDVPAVGGSHGVFADLHGHAGGGEFAEALKRCATENHGLAGPAFLKWLVPRVAKDAAWPQQHLAPRIGEFLQDFLPAGADGQVRAIARRFGQVALAGECASEAGVTGWAKGEAWHAVGGVFEDWLAKRGSLEATEDLAAIDRVRSAIEKNWRHRFAALGDDHPEFPTQDDIEKPKPPPDRGPVSGLGALGWKRWTSQHLKDGGGRWSYLFHVSGWREVLGSLDPVQSARALERHGFLIPGAKTASRIVKTPGHPNGVRVYEVRGEILGAGLEGSDS